jgi:hypothetical protein
MLREVRSRHRFTTRGNSVTSRDSARETALRAPRLVAKHASSLDGGCRWADGSKNLHERATHPERATEQMSGPSIQHARGALGAFLRGRADAQGQPHPSALSFVPRKHPFTAHIREPYFASVAAEEQLARSSLAVKLP